ncbi:frizzled-5-like [Saccoglossus kowalevskii]|uniref:Frizzled-2-like n=1 Tax=Saccoglossus kowalevskii TaxID=10224 RepID=A0ABM0GN33_SACKO|nr:PREDICTED: frizzled-2-like [Saccoglossus kowalevskii]
MTAIRVLLPIFVVCIFYGVFIAGKKCERVRLAMCQDMPYRRTQLPNRFNQSNQDEISLEMRQFWPLVEIECSPYLSQFLCSLYLPPCRTALPCRSLCESTRRGCAPVMAGFGFQWPENFDCQYFPEDDADCIAPAIEDVTVLPTPATKTETTLSIEESGEGRNLQCQCQCVEH